MFVAGMDSRSAPNNAQLQGEQRVSDDLP